jgi:hypothetical protein
MKNNIKKIQKKRPIVTFEADDNAVLQALSAAESVGHGEKSRMINEAIRLHGARALVNVLQQDVEIAEAKLRRVQDTSHSPKR